MVAFWNEEGFSHDHQLMKEAERLGSSRSGPRGFMSIHVYEFYPIQELSCCIKSILVYLASVILVRFLKSLFFITIDVKTLYQVSLSLKINAQRCPQEHFLDLISYAKHTFCGSYVKNLGNIA